MNVGSMNRPFATNERLESLFVGYVNFYAWPGGSGHWGKPHASRSAAENAERHCGYDGRKVVARLVARWKPGYPKWG
jgi:hypothetical protein